MKCLFLKSFLKDIQKINDKTTKSRLKKLIEQLEQADSLEDIGQVKKLKGYPTAYRIRLGDYRLGFYLDGQELVLARFVKRNDIYKLFP